MPLRLTVSRPDLAEAQFLPVGAIFATVQQTVASVFRVMGLSGDRNYARCHHVLDRAFRSPFQVSRILQ